MSEKIPITVPMLATIFRRKEATVSLALDTFVQFGMVEIVDNVITIPNWGKHQNLDKIEEKQKYMREYMRGYRLRQKEKIALPEADIEDESQQEQSRKVYGKANRKANVSSLEEDKEVDIEYIYNSPEPKIDSEPPPIFHSIRVKNILFTRRISTNGRSYIPQLTFDRS